jgi:hypothetical protein
MVESGKQGRVLSQPVRDHPAEIPRAVYHLQVDLAAAA